ncbi:hypothetical protein JB92DRAFT_154061 [Gautieria morchelliformis]|nr:hypothetical protein JB92DRAFT_154061 [Gautieria morchelliformis]
MTNHNNGLWWILGASELIHLATASHFTYLQPRPHLQACSPLVLTVPLLDTVSVLLSHCSFPPSPWLPGIHIHTSAVRCHPI